MRKGNAFLIKVLSCIVSITFFLSASTCSAEITSQKLAPPVISVEFAVSEASDAFRSEVMGDMKLMSVVYSVAQEYFENGSDTKGIYRALLDKFGYAEDLLRGLYLDLSDLAGSGLDGDGVLKIGFSLDGGRSRGVIGVCPLQRGERYRISDRRWEKVGAYYFFIERAQRDDAGGSSDLKGDAAPETDPLIKEHIQKSRVVELYIDPEDGTLKGNRVKWVRDYDPGVTSESMYRGYEVDVFQIFSKDQRKTLEEWMVDHAIRGSPVRIRVILGNASIGWEDELQRSNIAHAGIRDNVIYIGSLLLKQILRQENILLREEILEKDELAHLQGKEHGSPEDVKSRLEMARKLIEDNDLERTIQAVENNNVNYLVSVLRDNISRENSGMILEFLSTVNDIAMGQILYPVESTYPIKHAVSLLSREEQDRLVDILNGSVSRARGYRYQVVVDELLLMIDESQKLAEWIDVYAPHLEARSLWQISPEIWHEAGGLARVMQYHGAGMKELIGRANVRFRHIEPHYQNRVDPSGKAYPLDYTNREQITHPVQGELEEVARFTVTVGGREVKAIASRGVNDLGIEVYLIKDEGGFFTHSLYNYRNPWDMRNDLPTWEEFSVFYSKAALELVRIIEAREKEALEELHMQWKAPFLHLNDSQVALVSSYRKIFYDDDPILGKAIVGFTTHTYGNRKEYPIGEGYGDGVLDFMEIPYEFREMFKHCQRGGDVYDMASAGLRMADWQGAVARAHRDDVFIYDDWVNYPEDPDLAAYYRERGVEYSLVGVSNGDHRSNTMKHFIDKLRKLYGENVDFEHPTPEQVFEAKKLAKLELRLSDKKVYYSTHIPEEEGEAMLRPDQLVVSYSGRLVPEKAGRTRAFIDHNIEEMLNNGIQVVIYGNVQSNNSASDKLRDDFIALTERLKDKNYPGRLIFVPRFSLDDQRALLAASDVQVQDSHPSTEAAGFTEADISSCGGIEVGTPRSDNRGGEGLFQAQGVPMNLENPGEGNVLTPERLDSGSYLDAILKLNEKYNGGTLKHYQATSVRLSRILEAKLTSAAYLREFSKAVEYKEYMKNRKDKVRRAPLGQSRPHGDVRRADKSLLEEIYSSDPGLYEIYLIQESLEKGELDAALRLFFASGYFQGRLQGLTWAAELFNRVIDRFKASGITYENATDFLLSIRKGALEFGGEKDVSGSLQLMSGQALTVISWIQRDLDPAHGIRITSDPGEMAVARDKERGHSFISVPRGAGIDEAAKEGHPGFYWRGIERIKKLGVNVLTSLKYAFSWAMDELVMYLMNHGAVPVPEGLKEATHSGRISTLHETFFVNDNIPGSLQTTSTGAGHYQAEKLDIKYVTEGSGVQVNVKYGPEGSIEEVIAHHVKAGDWTLSLPGYVDYAINLGGLRFNDISVSLSAEEAARFNPGLVAYSESGVKDEEFALAMSKEASGLDIKIAPYIGYMAKDGPSIIETGIETSYRWIDGLQGMSSAFPEGLISLYRNADSFDDIKRVVEQLSVSFNESISASREYEGSSAGEREAVSIVRHEELKKVITPEKEKTKPFSVNGSQAILEFLDTNALDVANILNDKEGSDRLFRVSVEFIENAGVEDIKELLRDLQAAPRFFLELYSQERPQGFLDTHGIVIKELPDTLKPASRNRANTVTLFPVFKGEKLSPNRNRRWGGEDFTSSIISPVGYNYDRGGIVRGIVLGARLSEIAADASMDGNDEFVRNTLESYRAMCMAQGVPERNFDLTGEDIINMARGEAEALVKSLNRLIRLLPIVPVNTEELINIYQRMREALIRA